MAEQLKTPEKAQQLKTKKYELQDFLHVRGFEQLSSSIGWRVTIDHVGLPAKIGLVQN